MNIPRIEKKSEINKKYDFNEIFSIYKLINECV